MTHLTYNARVALFQVALVLLLVGLAMMHHALCLWWERDTARRAAAYRDRIAKAEGWTGR